MSVLPRLRVLKPQLSAPRPASTPPPTVSAIKELTKPVVSYQLVFWIPISRCRMLSQIASTRAPMLPLRPVPRTLPRRSLPLTHPQATLTVLMTTQHMVSPLPCSCRQTRNSNLISLSPTLSQQLDASLLQCSPPSKPSTQYQLPSPLRPLSLQWQMQFRALQSFPELTQFSSQLEKVINSIKTQISSNQRLPIQLRSKIRHKAANLRRPEMILPTKIVKIFNTPI